MTRWNQSLEIREFLRVKQVKEGRDLWWGQGGLPAKQRQYKAGGKDVGREIDHMAGGALGLGPGNQESCLRLLTHWFPVRLGQWRKWWEVGGREEKKSHWLCFLCSSSFCLCPPRPRPPWPFVNPAPMPRLWGSNNTFFLCSQPRGRNSFL